MDLELISWIKDGKYRIKTLKELSQSPLLSSELAKKLNINRVSMSRIIRALYEKNLVNATSNKTRTVLYSITTQGKKLLNELGKSN